MLQKKPPVKPEHTERTDFEDTIRSRKSALGQRCAAGVPEMDSVDGFPARNMGMPAQDHIAGAHATDLIAECALALQMGASVADIAGTIHAHPTLAEGIMEAAAKMAE